MSDYLTTELAAIQARTDAAFRCFESDPAYKILRTDIPGLVAALRVAAEALSNIPNDASRCCDECEQMVVGMDAAIEGVEAALRGEK